MKEPVPTPVKKTPLPPEKTLQEIGREMNQASVDSLNERMSEPNFRARY